MIEGGTKERAAFSLRKLFEASMLDQEGLGFATEVCCKETVVGSIETIVRSVVCGRQIGELVCCCEEVSGGKAESSKDGISGGEG